MRISGWSSDVCSSYLPLLYRCIGRCRAAYLNNLRIIKEFVGQLLDGRWHGGRKKQGLPCGGQLGANFLDIRDEPHIEHSVSLIDHEEIASGEKDITAPEQVHKPSRRGDQHIDALFQRLYLIPHRHATNEQRHASSEERRVGKECVSPCRYRW